jgi:hypothetical protein
LIEKIKKQGGSERVAEPLYGGFQTPDLNRFNIEAILPSFECFPKPYYVVLETNPEKVLY